MGIGAYECDIHTVHAVLYGGGCAAVAQLLQRRRAAGVCAVAELVVQCAGAYKYAEAAAGSCPEVYVSPGGAVLVGDLAYVLYKGEGCGAHALAGWGNAGRSRSGSSGGIVGWARDGAEAYRHQHYEQGQRTGVSETGFTCREITIGQFLHLKAIFCGGKITGKVEHGARALYGRVWLMCKCG